MKRKPYPITELTKGMNVDVDAVFLTDNESPNLSCCYFENGLVKKDVGFSSFGSLGSERVMYLDNLYLTDGTEVTYAIDMTQIYTYSSGSWSAVTDTDVFTGDEDDQFSVTVFNDVAYIANGKDEVQAWSGTGACTDLAGLASISAYAKAITSFNTRLIVGGTQEGGNDCPYRIRWCAAGEPTHWDPSTYPNDAGYIDLVETSDWIVGFGILADRLFVFKERSIWEVLPTGDSDVFEVRLVIDGIGTYCGQSIVSLGDVLMFFGTDGVYEFDGTSLRSRSGSIYPLLYTTGVKKVNTSKVNRSPCAYIEELGHYILVLPTIGDDPDWMITYNVNEESWSQRDKDVTAMGFWSQGDFTDWASATGYWDAADWSVDWISKQLPPGAPVTLFGVSNGTVEVDDRLQESTEQFLWETKDFVFRQSHRVTEVGFRVKGNGSFSVRHSTDQGRTWQSTGTVTPDENDFTYCKLFLNLSCETIRFRIITLATRFQLAWVEPWYIPRERVVTATVGN